MTFFEFIKKFPDEESCIAYYLNIRYPKGVHCNHCGSPKTYQRNGNLKLFDCKDCFNTFSPFKDTIFEKSCTDLRKWFYAIHLFLNGKKGVSALQLQREIGVTYKTAWRMLHQIRAAMGNAEQTEFINTMIEMDETYVGGKPRKKNDHHDDNDSGGVRGRGTSKMPVIGALDRKNKKVYAKVSMPDKEGRKVTFNHIMDVLSNVAKPLGTNVVVTDEFNAYSPLKRNKYFHLKVDHRQAFSNCDGVHTNTIESFWATLKRGVYGIYHHVSVKHMQAYVDEFCFRYNNRGLNMFDMVLLQAKI